MQMEAKERYRRDMVAAQDFVREKCEDEIQVLKDNLQQSHIENVKLQMENEKIQSEMSERIRILEEQLKKVNFFQAGKAITSYALHYLPV